MYVKDGMFYSERAQRHIKFTIDGKTLVLDGVRHESQQIYDAIRNLRTTIESASNDELALSSTSWRQNYLQNLMSLEA